MDFLEVQPQPNDDALASLADLASTFIALETQVNDAEATFKAKKEHLRRVSEELIPAAMERIGMEKFKLTSGIEIATKPDLSATLPVEISARARAFSWMREHGGESLIKRAITAEFGKGDNAAANALVDLMQKRGDRYEDKEAVHPSTLKSWVRELMENGRDVPFEVLGVRPFTKTTVKLPKKGKED